MSTTNSGYKEVPLEFQHNFHSFELMYPTVESRHQAALQLADPVGLSELDDNYHSRKILIGHWGDDTKDLMQTAFTHYHLSETIKRNIGQLAIVIRTGTTSDVLDKTEEHLNDDVTIEYGIVASPTLNILTAGNTTNRGPARNGIRPPFLGFGTSVMVANKGSLTIDIFGECEPISIARNKDDLLTHVGTVPIDFDRDRYAAEKRVKHYEIISGRRLCGKLIDALKFKTRNANAYRQLSNLPL